MGEIITYHVRNIRKIGLTSENHNGRNHHLSYEKIDILENTHCFREP